MTAGLAVEREVRTLASLPSKKLHLILAVADELNLRISASSLLGDVLRIFKDKRASEFKLTYR